MAARQYFFVSSVKTVPHIGTHTRLDSRQTVPRYGLHNLGFPFYCHRKMCIADPPPTMIFASRRICVHKLHVELVSLPRSGSQSSCRARFASLLPFSEVRRKLRVERASPLWLRGSFAANVLAGRS